MSSTRRETAATGEVTKITDLVSLAEWPAGTRMLVRRDQPHPGAQLLFTDLDGYRYQVFVTDLPEADPGLPGSALPQLRPHRMRPSGSTPQDTIARAVCDRFFVTAKDLTCDPCPRPSHPRRACVPLVGCLTLLGFLDRVVLADLAMSPSM